MAWWARAEVPLDSGWSKNRMWLLNRNGSRRLSPAAAERRSALAAALRDRMSASGAIARQNRLWLAVHASKGDHRIDALNVLDLVADAVQDATGIDDRWYEIDGLTWDIRPDAPRLVVAIGQENLPNAVACARCGALWPVDRVGPDTPEQGDCPPCRRGRRPQRSRATGMPPLPADIRPGVPPPWGST